MLDFSIIIPHRGNDLGLWATVMSCEKELQETNHSYNYSFVVNGAEKESDFLIELKRILENNNKLGYYHFSKDSIAPPIARAMAADNSDCKVLAFFDNHCIPEKFYFDYMMQSFEDSEVDVLHSSHIYFPMQHQSFQYNLNLSYDFWGKESGIPEHPFKKYKVGASGHGGFGVRKSCWTDIGGYGPATLLNGYAGEETIFDLKVWRMGKKVWLHPNMIHYHYAGAREYSKHYTDDYYINLLVSAFVIGGEKWLNIVFDSYITKPHPKTFSNKLDLFTIYEIAYSRGLEYSKELDSKAIYSLDELLEKVFPEQEVAF